MKKIPTMFLRDEKDRSRVTDRVDPRCQWVTSGEGTATEKHDGLAVLVRDGKLFKRFDAKPGRKPPMDFEPCETEPDPVSKHWPGWIPCDTGADHWIYKALADKKLADGTYEFMGLHVGTRSGANPHNMDHDILVRHATMILPDAPRTFEDIREFLRHHPMEGIVFHHPDGRMAKVKSRDLGLPWPVK